MKRRELTHQRRKTKAKKKNKQTNKEMNDLELNIFHTILVEFNNSEVVNQIKIEETNL